MPLQFVKYPFQRYRGMRCHVAIPLLLTIFFVVVGQSLLAQCSGFPSLPVDADCQGATTLVSSANIHSGQTHGTCDLTASVYTNINLSGGTVRVCGNTTFNGNFNSGTLVVACGATLTIPGSMTINNSFQLVNYGTLEVQGNLQLQNANTLLANIGSGARILIDGDLTYPQNVSENTFLINEGYISIANNFNAREGGNYCLNEGSIIDCDGLNYMANCGAPSDRFTHTGSSSATVYVGSSASLRSSLTATSSIELQLASGATVSTHGCGSTGSATVTTSAPAIAQPSAPSPGSCAVDNCYTRSVTLPVELVAFSATQTSDGVNVQWNTSSETNCWYFEVQRATEQMQWQPIAEVQGQGTTSRPSSYVVTDAQLPTQPTYYRLVQVDLDGTRQPYNAVSVRPMARTEGTLRTWPNPSSSTVYVEACTQPVLTNTLGQPVPQPMRPCASNDLWQLQVDDLPAGWYIVSAGGRHQRLLVQ